MIIPIDIENLFEVNNNCKIVDMGDYLIIDDFYKNFDNIYFVSHHTPIERWKSSKTSRNFIDYYDCRLRFFNNYPDQDKIQNRLTFLVNLIGNKWNDKRDFVIDKQIIFNHFKNKNKNTSNKYQHYPHKDLSYNIITYIDMFENGGTAIYEETDIEDLEHENLLYDISKLKIKYIIESKPNRCVIFKGDQVHGGFIRDHNVYYHNWRVNQVAFIK